MDVFQNQLHRFKGIYQLEVRDAGERGDPEILVCYRNKGFIEIKRERDRFLWKDVV